jgi:hypothetical protein
LKVFLFSMGTKGVVAHKKQAPRRHTALQDSSRRCVEPRSIRSL